MALDFGNKVSNSGINACGKLTAEEFNQLVAQINTNENDIKNIDANKFGCLRITSDGYLQGFASDANAALYDADPVANAALLRLNVLIPSGTGGGEGCDTVINIAHFAINEQGQLVMTRAQADDSLTFYINEQGQLCVSY